MPTVKIKDLPKENRCRNSEHYPPTNYVYTDGVWEHTCPSCGKKQTFTIKKPTLTLKRTSLKEQIDKGLWDE